MARIACFSDTPLLVNELMLTLLDEGHDLHCFSARLLDQQVRMDVRDYAPDLILFELTASFDTIMTYIFLRADEATRHIPLCFITRMPHLRERGQALGAEEVLVLPFGADELLAWVDQYVAEPLHMRSIAA